MKNHISALVIGKSGTGKSEFILSLIDKEQSKMIPASGEGQTTRSSAEYFIDFSNERELSIEIELKSKDEFVEERMRVVETYFASGENKVTDFVNKDTYKSYIDDFRLDLIHDNAFFNCNEFGESTANSISDLFNAYFSKSFWEKHKELSFLKDSESESLDKLDEFTSTVKQFWKEVYDLCRKEIKQDKLKFELQNDESEEIKKYLKVCEDGKSYSAIVKKIKISSKGSALYKSMFEKNRIDSITLIDTYGLDHAEQTNELELTHRYSSLLHDEFPDVKAVFYLKNISQPGSSSDLKPGIVTLFKVQPSIVPYIIFTFIDKIYDCKDHEAYKEYKAYKAIDDVVKKKKKTLVKQGVSTSLIASRTEELLATRIGYASKIEDEDDIKKEIIEKVNIPNLDKVFSSIRFEKYLGSAYIPINLMKLDKVRKVLSCDKLFENRNLCDYPNATKGAIRVRIEPKKGRVLGFSGSTTVSTRWSDIIATDLNKKFTNVIKCYDWKNYLMQKVPENLCPDIIKAIEELFVLFSKELYIGASNNVEALNTNYCGNQIIKCLYNDRKNIIDNRNPKELVGKYLSDIYAFETISDYTKSKIQDIINTMYTDWFIKKCRLHNARKIAEKITNDTTDQEKKRILEEYYSAYDDNISNEEKVEFELMVNDNTVLSLDNSSING